MRRLLVALVVALGSAWAQGDDARTRAALDAARADAKDLGAVLRTLLAAELATGGYPGAVRACSELAQKAAREQSARTGRDIRRVSLRWRNPAGKPDAYEKEKIESMQQAQARKELAEEYWEVVRGGEPKLRYLKPVKVEAMCLGCHGPDASISPAVKNALAAAYPDDRATGYQAGDLRGAISVAVPLR